MQRLSWKNALLKEFDAKRHAAPMDLVTLEDQYRNDQDIDYSPVRFRAAFLDVPVLRFYWVHEGRVGWRLASPARLSDGRVVMIDRGFVEQGQIFSFLSPDTGSPDTGSAEMIGRSWQPAAPGLFTPENDLEDNIWYWWDLPAMAGTLGVDVNRVVPYVISLETDGDGPLSVVSAIRIENHHFGYALTWFALAVALVGVCVSYLIGVMKESRKSEC